jgi:hypothetical protein
MTRALILTLAAAAALAACDNSDHTIVAGPGADRDNMSNSAANSEVTLPPAIAATKLYRCSGDNSVVQIDWLADNKTANVRIGDNAPATQVTAAEQGQPMTAAGGLSVIGTAAGASITVKLPEGATKTCHV